jgi:hypothetical protein
MIRVWLNRSSGLSVFVLDMGYILESSGSTSFE